jgi:hypothetical protein
MGTVLSTGKTFVENVRPSSSSKLMGLNCVCMCAPGMKEIGPQPALITFITGGNLFKWSHLYDVRIWTLWVMCLAGLWLGITILYIYVYGSASNDRKNDQKDLVVMLYSTGNQSFIDFRFYFAFTVLGHLLTVIMMLVICLQIDPSSITHVCLCVYVCMDRNRFDWRLIINFFNFKNTRYTNIINIKITSLILLKNSINMYFAI